MKAAGRIWLEMDNGTQLGHGKIELLALAGELCSLRKAAERMQISYRQAWYKINQMNKMSDQVVLVLSRGGKNGGEAQLTDLGKRLISQFNKLQKSFDWFIEEANS